MTMLQVFDSLGVEPQFWLVLGEENPLKDYAFHELTFLQRVWLLKGLCDFLLVSCVKDVFTDLMSSNVDKCIGFNLIMYKNHYS